MRAATAKERKKRNTSNSLVLWCAIAKKDLGLMVDLPPTTQTLSVRLNSMRGNRNSSSTGFGGQRVRGSSSSSSSSRESLRVLRPGKSWDGALSWFVGPPVGCDLISSPNKLYESSNSLFGQFPSSCQSINCISQRVFLQN